jgi:hypothetical protein
MFAWINQLAEHVAASASRRQFLGRLGRGAMVIAATAGGLLATPGESHAAGTARCCYYRCGGRGGTRGYYVCRSDGSACRTSFSDPRLSSCALRSQSFRNCADCRSF